MTRLVSQGRILRPTYDETVGGVRKVRKHSILPGQFIPSLNFRHQLDDDAVAGLGTLTPTAATRASDAYERADTAGVQLWTAKGSNVIRLASVQDLNGLAKTCEQIEPAGTNVMDYSEALDSWDDTSGNIASIDTNNPLHPTPFASKDFDGIIGEDESSAKYVRLIGFATLSAAPWVISGYWKKGSDPRVRFDISQTSLGTATVYFDLDNGAIGTESNATGRIEHVGNGIYLCSMTCTMYAEAANCWLRPATAGDSAVTVSDGTTVQIWGMGMQCELGNIPSSYIINAGTGNVTRAADVYYHKLDDGALVDGKGSIAFSLLVPDHTPVAAINVLEISDGGAAADSVLFQVQTDGTMDAIMNASGGTTRTATIAGDCADGIWHDYHLQWQAGQLIVRRDGVAGINISATVAADIPDNLDRLTRVKANIANIQVWNQPYWPGV